MSSNDGVGAPLKVSCFLTRRQDLTREQFHQYWTEKHTPMLAKPVEGFPRVLRYVQLHPVSGGVAALYTAAYDDVAEIWFESLADAAAMFTSCPRYHRQPMRRDGAGFRRPTRGGSR